MSTKSKPKPSKRPDGTLNALCSALKLSKGRISALLQLGMPDSVPQALAWRKARATDDSVRLLREKRIALLHQQERKAKLDADQQAGLLVLCSDVNAEMLKTCHMVKRGMWDLQNALPGELVGCSELEMCKRIRAHLTRVMNGLASDKYCTDEAREVVSNLNP